MPPERTPNLDEFASMYCYPGRSLAIGKDSQGVSFAAYWLTGRSPQSRSRRVSVDRDTLEIGDVSAPDQSDPLRHYTAIIRNSEHVIVGNGTQVTDVAAELSQGVSAFHALSRLEYEPDPPIHTPRITAVLSRAGDDFEDVTISGAISDTRWTTMAQHYMFHILRQEPGQGHAVTTYSGDAENISTSGKPSQVAIDASWDKLLDQIWDNLAPSVRVAACVVPLAGDLREGRFAGIHEPVIHAGTGLNTK
ncbi:IMP cyclohydrolase [Nocardia sp. NPDC051750]|uniref:IMP cyclohydrolase n=1 Tax=Nocardia sp. NPDC051750 TaxID=3364325 RepID=UPI00378CCEEF